MRKTIAVILAAGLVGGALLAAPADAKKRRKKPVKVERTEEAAYTIPVVGHTDAAGGCNFGGQQGLGCVSFIPSATENYVSFDVADVTGQTPYVSVTQGVDASGFAINVGSFCGKTAAPMAIQPGVEITLFINAGPGITGSCEGAAVQGTVTATLSNLP